MEILIPKIFVSIFRVRFWIRITSLVERGKNIEIKKNVERAH